jgi:hypothetical protein
VAFDEPLPQTSFGSWPSKSCLLAQVNRSIPVSATFAVFWSTQSVITVLFLLTISMKNLRTYLSPSPRHGSQSGRRSRSRSRKRDMPQRSRSRSRTAAAEPARHQDPFTSTLRDLILPATARSSATSPDIGRHLIPRDQVKSLQNHGEGP